jgi:hypothetical protein
MARDRPPCARAPSSSARQAALLRRGRRTDRSIRRRAIAGEQRHVAVRTAATRRSGSTPPHRPPPAGHARERNGACDTPSAANARTQPTPSRRVPPGSSRRSSTPSTRTEQAAPYTTSTPAGGALFAYQSRRTVGLPASLGGGDEFEDLSSAHWSGVGPRLALDVEDLPSTLSAAVLRACWVRTVWRIASVSGPVLRLFDRARCTAEDRARAPPRRSSLPGRRASRSRDKGSPVHQAAVVSRRAGA